MSCRCSIVGRLGLPDPVFVRYPGSDAAASSVKYIVCLNGRVSERYKLWSLNRHGVCEVHTTAWVKLFYLFAEDIISTRNILVYPWGKYLTLIGPGYSKYTCRAYIPITCQKGFNKRCEHERLRLLFVERKRTAFERKLSRFRAHMSDDVAMNYDFPPLNDALGMGSSDNSPRSSLPNHIEFRDDWILC